MSWIEYFNHIPLLSFNIYWVPLLYFCTEFVLISQGYTYMSWVFPCMFYALLKNRAIQVYVKSMYIKFKIYLQNQKIPSEGSCNSNMRNWWFFRLHSTFSYRYHFNNLLLYIGLDDIFFLISRYKVRVYKAFFSPL